MTMKEKLEMHKQIEQENREALERFQNEPVAGDLAGLIYRDNNMDKTFQKGDRLFILRHRFTQPGSIVVIELGPNVYHVCRLYRNKETGAATITDDLNPPLVFEEPPEVIGAVIGYERFFL